MKRLLINLPAFTVIRSRRTQDNGNAADQRGNTCYNRGNVCNLIIRRRIEAQPGSKESDTDQGYSRAYPGQKRSFIRQMLLYIFGVDRGGF
ncbi:hypothetical protein AAIH57_01510 [Paenibacillus sp. MABNR03]